MRLYFTGLFGRLNKVISVNVLNWHIVDTQLIVAGFQSGRMGGTMGKNGNEGKRPGCWGSKERKDRGVVRVLEWRDCRWCQRSTLNKREES